MVDLDLGKTAGRLAAGEAGQGGADGDWNGGGLAGWAGQRKKGHGIFSRHVGFVCVPCHFFFRQFTIHCLARGFWDDGLGYCEQCVEVQGSEKRYTRVQRRVARFRRSEPTEIEKEPTVGIHKVHRQLGQQNGLWLDCGAACSFGGTSTTSTSKMV